MRLIDADALSNALKKEYLSKDVDVVGKKTFEAINHIYGLILQSRTIEAEPIKHGRWLIGVGENGEPIGTYCSECGWSWVNGVAAVNLNKALSLIKTPRCPWCGAKMDEVEHG